MPWLSDVIEGAIGTDARHFIHRTTAIAIAITTTVTTILRSDGRGPQAAAVSFMFGVGGVGGVIGS